MSLRFVALLFLCSLLLTSAHAKDKKVKVLSDFILRAETVYVVIDPGAAEPLANPTANSTARNDVEVALQKWGRLRLTDDERNADLIVSVRKGEGPADGPTVKGGPVDDRPVIFQPQQGGIRVGAGQGRPPIQDDPGTGSPRDTGPRLGTQKAPSEDVLEVFQGKNDDPLSGAPVWRYAAKGALQSPKVPAVDRFRKAIEEAEMQGKSKP